MTYLEAVIIARAAAERVAAEIGIPTGELLGRKTTAAVAGRRKLVAELSLRMPVGAIAKVLGLSTTGVRLLLGVSQPQQAPTREVWCALNGDDLIVCKSYWAAKKTVLNLRKSGIRGAEIVRREVGNA